jgi:hypothetical protein
MRKNEERKKHDRLSRLLSGGRKRFFIALKKQLTHKNVLNGLACFLLTSDDEYLISCERWPCAVGIGFTNCL